MTKSYTEQFDRVNRYFNLFKQINNGKTHNQPSLYRDDVVISFFQHCYHLKDWIKNDPACSALKDDVEDFITNNPNLSICADICNATKHLLLTKPRSTENPSLDINDSVVKLVIKDGGNVPTSIDISVKYAVSTNSGDKDAFELAERCVLAWESFISSNT